MTGNRTLEVYYHKAHVGILAEMPDRRIAFQYTDDWLKNGFSISPLSLPLKKDVFVPPDTSRAYFGGLFGIFADSLPDSWGQLLLDRYLESIGIARDSITTLDRLSFVGRSGMGALEYYPSGDSEFQYESSDLDYDKIARECAKLLSSKKTKEIDLLYKMGGSCGGTRPKLLLSNEGKEWIVKFPAGGDPSNSGKIEYDYSLCAKKCGIVMTETKLIPSSVCDGYFMTERFDRRNGEKIFTASFAGLLEADFRAPACDYKTLLKLVRVLTKENERDTEQLFRIMCFNIFGHNLDDHVKNFAFLYTYDHGWRLAPAYDLTYSDTYWGEHTTSVNGKGTNITDPDIIKIGTEAGLSKNLCSQMIKEIKKEVLSLNIQ